ncbi:MAG: DJ-1/PfpI family protein [Phycisphaeraceae bacterium]|nr:DJ-1/PfpI family protein [Phycisphaeraceae bacterium]
MNRDAGTTCGVQYRILLYPGFDELDAIAPFEVLSMAARRLAPASDAWCVDLETINGAEEVRASNGLVVRIERRAPTGHAPQVLIVPGGGWVDRSRIGAWSEFERGDGPGTVARAVREAHARGTIIASVCTGAMLLARADLLRGRRAITHHAAIDDLERCGAVIVRDRVVDDGEIITAGGVTSGIDLALHLVERFASAAHSSGKSLADEIARTLEHPRTAATPRPSSRSS